MENESEETKTPEEEQSCWIYRTKLEKGLFCLLTLSVILAAVLLMTILLFTKTPSAKSNSCNTTTCLSDALEIIKMIDTTNDPCDDFLAFTCQKNMSFSNSEDELHPPELEDDEELILELYQAAIEPSDHKVIKTVKKMFQACINKTEIENTSFYTVKEIIKSLGGWPVVEGRNWTESNFDWLNATDTLRKHGLDHSILLKISIDDDPSSKNKYIYKVSIPRIKDVHSKWFDTEDTKEFLAEVALVFGAEKHHAYPEMAETLQFLKDLQWKSNDVINSNEKPRRLKVSEIQKRHDGIDWLEFINKIIGPTGKITKNDYILFPNESDIDDWFALILREDRRLLPVVNCSVLGRVANLIEEPNIYSPACLILQIRTQANYVMWKIVENFLPYLTKQLDKGGLRPRLLWDDSERSETQAEFCIEQINSKFVPNPIDILYSRKNLPKEKFDEVEALIQNLILALTDYLDAAEWSDVKDRTKILANLKQLKKLCIGTGDQFNDKIFDAIAFDLDKGNSNNFIKMLGQATVHHTNIFYGLPKKAISETRIFVPHEFLPLDSIVENEIVLGNVVSGQFFQTDRQKYINYAAIGLFSLYYLPVDFGKIKKVFEQNKDCLNVDKKTKLPESLIDHLLTHRMVVKVSYDAYTKWEAENGEELPLAILNYTPKQLFWISAGKIFCQYTQMLENSSKSKKTFNVYKEIITKVINRNPNLLKDFGCKIDEKDETIDQCTIF